MPDHATLIDDLARQGGTVMLIGAPDTGKTTFARQLIGEATRTGKIVAYVDADIGQTTTGPPSCVGLKWVREAGDLERLAEADELRFVGSISPDRVVLQQVIATATLADVGRAEADLVVIDTTGTISGVIGQTLKYHKMELCRPDVAVGLQRGGELDPMVGMLRRFFSADVELIGVHPDISAVSPDERRAYRTKRFADAFAPPLQRWRVRSTVFAPTLPAGLDLGRLDRMLVGLHDGAGRCIGLGALDYEPADETLRVTTNTGEGMRGLRLGSLRIDLDTFDTTRVNLREVMFGF